jgi:hypothetical protein
MEENRETKPTEASGYHFHLIIDRHKDMGYLKMQETRSDRLLALLLDKLRWDIVSEAVLPC